MTLKLLRGDSINRETTHDNKRKRASLQADPHQTHSNCLQTRAIESRTVVGLGSKVEAVKPSAIETKTGKES